MITKAPFRIKGRKVLLLANHSFSMMWAKTAACFLMYRASDTVAVLDEDQKRGVSIDLTGCGFMGRYYGQTAHTILSALIGHWRAIITLLSKKHNVEALKDG